MAKPNQLLAIRNALDSAFAGERHHEDMRNWIDRYWEDVQKCLESPAEDESERLDQMEMATEAYDAWIRGWNPESPAEILPEEYRDLLGLEEATTYKDAWNVIDKTLDVVPLCDEYEG